MTEPTFTDYVELHERKWGEQDYLGRPNLKQLLNVPIVAMWKSGKRFKFSVHVSMESLSQAIQAILFGIVNEEEVRTLYKVFYHHQEQHLSISISLQSSEAEKSNSDEEQLSVDDSSPKVVDVNPQRNPRKPTSSNAKHEPKIADVDSQRDTRPHDEPHYYPRVVAGAKYGQSAPGRNEPHKPGRNAPLLKPKSESNK